MNWKKLIIGTLSWKRLFKSVAIVYVLATVMAYFYAEKLIFPYNQSSYDESVSGLKFLQAKDGTKIATRFWKASNEKALILYFHGNYMDIGHMDGIAKFLNVKNYSVLATDYRGYGLSQGKPKESNTYSDAQMVYDYALKQGYKYDNIIILGRSVGSGIATELAKNNKSKALILISPFLSAYRVITKFPLLLFDKFNNIAKIDKVATPLFIVHGKNDQIIPAWHSESLLEKHLGKHKIILIEGAGHNDIYAEEHRDFIDEIDLFLSEE